VIRGRREVLRNLNREIRNIEGDISRGLLAAGVFVEGESNEIVPHDKGVLINSSFVDLQRSRGRGAVRVGYNAKYADFVHEMPETNNFSKPGTSSGFLWKAVSRNARLIVEIIRSRARF